MSEKFSVFLENQGRRLKILALYAALVFVVFSIAAPNLNRAPDTVGQLQPTESVNTAEQPTITEPPKPAEQPKIAEPQMSAEQPKIAGTAAAQVTVKTAVPQMIRPLQGQIIRGFGLTYSQTYGDYRNHNGIDIAAQAGDVVAAAAAGKVLEVRESKNAACSVLLEHQGGWWSEYAQLGQAQLVPGERAVQGQTIGTVGEPGCDEALEGPHLHFALFRDGLAVDPQPYLSE